MKILLVRGNSCAEDVTEVLLRALGSGGLSRILSGEGDLLAAAPDRVFPGWGFDPAAVGDARFLRPVPPAGWKLDEETGTLYRAGDGVSDRTGTKDKGGI